jgi:hypothetical protein
VLRGSRVGAGARLSRRAGLAVVIACAAASPGASSAQAQTRTTTSPEELWRAYPLEQSPTTAAPAPAPRQATSTPAPAAEGSGSDPPWILLLGVVAGGAVGVVVALVLSRRQRARGALTNGSAEAETPQPARELRLPVPEPVEVVNEPVPPRAGPSSDTPICHVRWSRRGARFFAVTTEPDGTERRIARSPQFDWRGPSPPEQSPEAQAALRQLAKELRDKGWRPLRTKGIDFDERRWYARRFRWPTDLEDRPRSSQPGRARPSVRGRVR